MASKKASTAQPNKKVLLLRAALDRFLLSMVTSGKAKNTIRDYRHRLGMLIDLLETRCVEDGKPVSIKELKKVTTDHLRQVVYILQTEDMGRFRGRRRDVGPLRDGSVRVYVLTFKSFFNWCYDERLIVANPADARLKLPKVTKVVRSTFDVEDIQAMLNVCDRSTEAGFRDFTLLLVLFDTGMRISELATLKVDHVHAEYVKVEGKGRKEREIGVHTSTSMAVWKYIEIHRQPSREGERCVFLSRFGRSITSSGIHQIIKRIQTRAGLGDISVHAHLFRHTFAKFYMENGGDLFNLSRELGHSDIQTTKIYLEGFNSTHARKAHHKFSPVSLIEVKEKGRKRKK